MNALQIAERTLADGVLAPVTVRVTGDLIGMYVQDAQIGDVPLEALVAVMERFGKPLATDVPLPLEGLSLPSGATLRLLRHRGFYDVIARDWLVLERVGHEALADLAVSASAALEHLARAYARATP